MSGNPEPPDDIMDAIQVIQDLRDKSYMSRMERENLNRAKLRIAYWVCRNENIVASRENLSYILGSDAGDIMRAYDKYLEKDKEREKEEGKGKGKPKSKPGDPKKGGGGTQFWGNA